jgi:hypothetical protein
MKFDLLGRDLVLAHAKELAADGPRETPRRAAGVLIGTATCAGSEPATGAAHPAWAYREADVAWRRDVSRERLAAVRARGKVTFLA